MKISINSSFITGPFGGGMVIAALLKRYFVKKGVEVVNHLNDEDIDVILHLNPFTFLRSESASYSFFSAYLYKIKHPETVIIHQINECDERKNTNYMNKLLIKTSKYSDYTVFIASWLKPLLEKQGFPEDQPSSIILNGTDEIIFNTIGKKYWDGQEKMKIVTHHWGGSYLKGHDIYQKIDKLLGNKEFANKYQFTFIGNYPKDLEYKNTNLIKPISGEELANELKKHHIYITASRNEPAGLHHIEGILCGMPVLYVNSGALPEYCEGFGIEFNESNFEEKLEQIYKQYNFFVEKLKQYKNTGEKMSSEYYDLIVDLYEKRIDFSFKLGFFNKILRFVGVAIYGFLFSSFVFTKKVFRIIK